MENFKEFTYYGSNLLVGDQGTIYREGKLAKQYPTYDGYLQVGLKKASIKTHRLVAMCWVPGRTEERNEVNHKDFNRTNNCAENLEWVTHTENVWYSARAGRRGDISGERNPNWGNDTLHKRYMADPEFAKQCQSRPGSRNGHATPVEVFYNDELIGHFEYLGEAAAYMHEHYDNFPANAEAFRYGVRRSIAKGVPYKGFTFIKPA